MTHPAATTYIDQGAKWNDIVDGNGTADANGSVNSNAPGIYQITYSATDAAGNEAEPVVRTIHVVDNDAPIITLLGDANITHEAGPEYVDAGANWSDNVDGNGTADANGTVDHLVPGTYQITYNYTDSSGNTAHPVVRTIHVVDTTPPVITLNGDANLSIEAGLSYIEQGAKWTDIVDGNGSADANGSVDSNSPGVYQVVYSTVDSAGNAAISKVRTVKVTNDAPSDINYSSGLEFLENLPTGSFITSFVAHDPNVISSITLTLDDLNDSFDNDRFAIDQNGTLTTASSFDFESDPSNYLIRVKATDEHNASLSKVFEISLLNVVEDIDGDGIEDAYDSDRDGDGFENVLEVESGTDPNDQYSTINKPILETNGGIIDENGTFVLSGKVRVDGHGNVEDFGFILSSSISLDGNNVHWIRGQGSLDNFELRFEENPYKPTLYFRAWAKNPAGYGIGPVKKIEIPEPQQSWWGDIIAMPGGWMESPWFGLFIYYEKGWLYHSQLGWFFSSPDQNNGVWLWNEAQGWLWTKEGVWPYLFKNDSSDWLYFTTSNQQVPIFYDYSISNYIGLNEQSKTGNTTNPDTAESGSAQ